MNSFLKILLKSKRYAFKIRGFDERKKEMKCERPQTKKKVQNYDVLRFTDVITMIR